MSLARVQVITLNAPYPSIDVSCPGCKGTYTARAWISHDPHGWGIEEMRRMAGGWLRSHPCRRQAATAAALPSSVPRGERGRFARTEIAQFRETTTQGVDHHHHRRANVHRHRMTMRYAAWRCSQEERPSMAE